MIHPVRLGALVAAFLLTAGAAPAQQQQQQPAPAQAQGAAPTFSASHLALAREVAVNSGITRSLDVIAPQLFDRVRQQIVARPELTKDMDAVILQLQPEMELQKQRAIDTIAGIYARAISEAELKDIVAFFRSPAGKKYVDIQPAVLDDLVNEMQKWSQELAEYVMVRVRAEMGKRGHQLQ